MAINTLFQNIADAIREKTGSAGSLTPAQMPGAIRSINTGSITITELCNPITIQDTTVVNLNYNFDDFDFMFIGCHVPAAANYDFFESSLYKCSELLIGSGLIGVADDGSNKWLRINSRTQFQASPGGRNGSIFSFYGIKIEV